MSHRIHLGHLLTSPGWGHTQGPSSRDLHKITTPPTKFAQHTGYVPGLPHFGKPQANGDGDQIEEGFNVQAAHGADLVVARLRLEVTFDSLGAWLPSAHGDNIGKVTQPIKSCIWPPGGVFDVLISIGFDEVRKLGVLVDIADRTQQIAWSY